MDSQTMTLQATSPAVVFDTNSLKTLQGSLAPGVSLTMKEGECFVGDPPMGVPYPGTTHFDVQPAQHVTLDPWRERVVATPWGPAPAQPPWDGLPPAVTNIGLGVATLLANPWHLQYLADKLVARCDVPGAIPDSVSVEIVDRVIRVSYRRFDTNGLSRPAEQAVALGYDVRAAQATLELGVLSITVAASAAGEPFRVPVVAR